MDECTGYMHSGYAASLAEFGSPRELPRCGGWILQRGIPGTSYEDAMGCYPLFTCRDWPKLHADLAEIGDEVVSLALVADPFGDYDVTYLQKCFDVIIPFKQHFITDLRIPIPTIVPKSHQQTVRRAMRNVEVTSCPNPASVLNDWLELFAILVKRHSIKGIRAFSPTALARQLEIPGVVMFKAVSQGVVVGLDLWYIQGNVAYGHLAATSDLGYDLRASYALKWYLLHFFSDKVRWLDFGAGAGTKTDETNGLSQFKRTWSTGTMTAYFCGRVYDRSKYQAICQEMNCSYGDYFPAYRRGEFA